MNDITLRCILQSSEIPIAKIKPLNKNLYFQRSDGSYLLIQKQVTENEVMNVISNFLVRHYYISNYTRYWREGGKIFMIWEYVQVSLCSPL